MNNRGPRKRKRKKKEYIYISSAGPKRLVIHQTPRFLLILEHKWSSYIWRGRKERGPLRNVTVQDGAYLSTIAQKVMAVIIRRGCGGGINYKQEHWPRCVGTCARITLYPSITCSRAYIHCIIFFYFSYSFEQYSTVVYNMRVAYLDLVK